MSTFEDHSLSSFQIVKTAVLNTNKHFSGLIRDISFFLVCICVFTSLLDYYMKIFGNESYIVTIFEMIISWFLAYVIFFMTSLSLFNKTHPNLKKLTFWQFLKENIVPWIVRGLKAIIIVLAGLCLFIIPGIIKSIHYTFFSFVVFFNKNYKDGKIDALKHSKALSKGVGFWLFFLLFGPSFLICGLAGFYAGLYAGLYKQPISTSITYYPILTFYKYISYLLGIYMCSVLYFMYVIKDKNQMIKSDSIEVENL